MVFNGLFIQTLHGVQYGFLLFLVAAGISLSLGILNVLNVAHGEMFAAGAFLAIALQDYLLGMMGMGNLSVAMTLGLVVVSALVAGTILFVVGGVLEATFFRRIYDRDILDQLILTFGLLLVIRGIIVHFWGSQGLNNRTLYRALNDVAVAHHLGFNYPTFNLVIIIAGLLMLALLVWAFENTKTGQLVRTIAINREMATAIGVDASRNFTLVFAVSAMMAGIAGAMIAPQSGAASGMGDTFLVLSFVIVVIGGIGSLWGTFVGAMAVGIVSRWMTWQAPSLEFVAPYLIMIAVILVKPEGLFGGSQEGALE